MNLITSWWFDVKSIVVFYRGGTVKVLGFFAHSLFPYCLCKKNNDFMTVTKLKRQSLTALLTLLTLRWSLQLSVLFTFTLFLNKYLYF